MKRTAVCSRSRSRCFERMISKQLMSVFRCRLFCACPPISLYMCAHGLTKMKHKCWLSLPEKPSHSTFDVEVVSTGQLCVEAFKLRVADSALAWTRLLCALVYRTIAVFIQNRESEGILQKTTCVIYYRRQCARQHALTYEVRFSFTLF